MAMAVVTVVYRGISNLRPERVHRTIMGITLMQKVKTGVSP